MNKSVACMPLVENIPTPTNKQWTKTRCPMCGKECWITPLAIQTMKNNSSIRAACTVCALREGAQ